MDSDPPSIDDEDGARPDTPFASASSKGKSRIADQMARQRAAQRRGAAPQYLPKSAASGARHSAADDLRVAREKEAAKAKERQRIKTNTNSLGKLNQRVDERLLSIPALSISIGNITRMRWLIGTQSVAIAFLLGMMGISIMRLSDNNIYAAMIQPNPVVAFDDAGNPVAQTAEPRLQPILGLTTPAYTQQAILGWASTTATQIMNFGFHNAGPRLIGQRHNFTDRGWVAFSNAVSDAKILENIVTKEQVITAAPVGAPVIVKTTDMPDGNREWVLQIPFMTTVLSGAKTDATRSILTMTVIKVPTSTNLTGLGIDNWVQR